MSRKPLDFIKTGDVCAEIGVWKGDFSSEILNKKPSQLHLIDPWAEQYENRLYSIPQPEMDAVYNFVKDKFNDNPGVIIHRNYSTKVELDVLFDWVYIDGDHNYESVKKDLEFYYKLIKPGGWLCGDDYGWADKNCLKGVKPAVDEFCKNNNLPVKIYGTQYVIKIN